MKKTLLSVVGLAVAVLAVALVLTVGGPDEALAGKNSKCPSGTQKLVKVCISKEARDPATFAAASADCADEAGRLPTGAELDAFRFQPGIDVGGEFDIFEWTGDIFDEDQTLGILETSSGVLYTNIFHSNGQPYRCVK